MDAIARKDVPERAMDCDEVQLRPVRDGFNEARSDGYASATASVPYARDEERAKVRAFLDEFECNHFDRILEIGIGQGFGTEMLLPRLTNDGMIHAIDASESMVNRFTKNDRVQVWVGSLLDMRLEDNSIDFAFSLAAFHHVSNKSVVLEELYRIMRPGAHFLIVDVNHGTQAQRMFDYVVAKHCPQGHDADFLDEEWVTMLCRRIGFEHVASRIESTPWQFRTEQSMVDYIKALLCLHIPTQEVRQLTHQYLSPEFDYSKNKWDVDWSLGFHMIQKPG